MASEPVLKRVRRREPLLPRDVNTLTQFDQLPILELLLPHLTMDDVISIRTGNRALGTWGKTSDGMLFPWVKLTERQTNLMLKQHWVYGGYYWGDNIHTVYVWAMPWGDVDSESRYIFANARNVTLSNISGLSDVSVFARVHTLKLWQVNHVTDVSALGNIHTLMLGKLPLVTDVSMLGTVQDLSIGWMDGLDATALGNVHTLSVNAVAMTNMQSLRNVHDLTLIRVKRLHASWFSGVHTLYLEEVRLDEIASLGSIHKLTLNGPIWVNGPSIQDISMLNTVHTLSLRNLPRVTNVSSLGRGTIQDLTLDSMNEVHNISGLESVPILRLIKMGIMYGNVIPQRPGLTMKDTTFHQGGAWRPPRPP